MDLQKLIESQSKLARRRPGPGEAMADPESVNRPVELRQAQADRLKERIESLEMSKAALIESIDVELQELKEELTARTQGIQVERKRLEGAAKAVAEAAGIKTPKKAAADATADAAADPKEKKTARNTSAKDTKPG